MLVSQNIDLDVTQCTLQVSKVTEDHALSLLLLKFDLDPQEMLQAFGSIGVASLKVSNEIF